MLAMRSSSSPHIYAVGEPTGFQNRIGPLLTFFFIFFLAPSPDSYTSSPGLPDNTARPHIKRNFFHPHPRLGREDCSESRHIFFSLRTPILSGPPPATAMSDSGDESEAKEPAAMGVQGTDTKDPYSNAIGDHVRALYESCFCYHYPVSCGLRQHISNHRCSNVVNPSLSTFASPSRSNAGVAYTPSEHGQSAGIEKQHGKARISFLFSPGLRGKCLSCAAWTSECCLLLTKFVKFANFPRQRQWFA